MNKIREKVLKSLRKLQLQDTKIDAAMDDAGNVFATVESSTFDGMEESERQTMVWRQLRSDLVPDEQARVEFVFTRDSDGG